MDANFFYYSIYDRFTQTTMCLHACVCAFVNFFFKKTFLETIDLTVTKFQCSLDKG